MKNKKKVLLICGIVALIIVSNLCTFFVTKYCDTNMGKWSKITKLANLVDSTFYKDVETDKVIDGALKGMFDALGDKYSQYYTKEEYDIIEDSLREDYQGIGIYVTENEKKNTLIVQVIKDTPAEKQGLKEGDMIVKVDNETVIDRGMDYTVSKIKGKAGTQVKLTVKRDDKEIEMDITRAEIHITAVESMVIDDFGYIVISSINESSAADFESYLKKLVSKNIKGLILDLRFNGGGLVDQAVKIVDCLAKKDTLVVYTVDKNKKRVDYRCESDQSLSIPLIILVNEETASAAEIITGAVQDHKIGKIVGTQTFGKGIVQEMIPLYDGSGVKITFSEYFTPSGKNIHQKGITPDYVVEQPEEYKNFVNIPYEYDVQLQKAVEILKKK